MFKLRGRGEAISAGNAGKMRVEIKNKVERIGEKNYPNLALKVDVRFLTLFYGEIPERSKGAVCKTVGSAFVGSNPTLATRRKILLILSCMISFVG